MPFVARDMTKASVQRTWDYAGKECCVGNVLVNDHILRLRVHVDSFVGVELELPSTGRPSRHYYATGS